MVRDLDGNKGLAYSDFSVIAIAAIQEQQQLIEKQKAQIAAMSIKQQQFEKELEAMRKQLGISGK